MVATRSNDEMIATSRKGDRPVEVLLRICETARLLRLSDGRLYAEVPVGDRRETYALASKRFRRWLIHGYRGDCGKVPSDWAILRVLGALEASASFDGDARSIFVRVGREASGDSSNLYLDLGDATGQAVRIGPDGWELVQNPPIHFHRPDGLLPIPTPSRDGSIELLRPYVNLDEPEFRQMVVWMAAALRPVGPYPILADYGELRLRRQPQAGHGGAARRFSSWKRPSRECPLHGRLDRHGHRPARQAECHSRETGRQLGSLAEIDSVVLQRAPPRCPPAPHPRHIRHILQKPRPTVHKRDGI